jgi:hypothetical protein
MALPPRSGRTPSGQFDIAADAAGDSQMKRNPSLRLCANKISAPPRLRVNQTFFLSPDSIAIPRGISHGV